MKQYTFILTGLCCCTLALPLHAQTFDEWFRQGRTRKKYLVKQIAALETLLLTCEKGWSIAEKGIQDIGEIRNGEFNLHHDFFQGLLTVNPEIKNRPDVREIIAREKKLAEEWAQSIRAWRRHSSLSADEWQITNMAYTYHLESGKQKIDALVDLTTDGRLQLSDGERIRAIQSLDAELQEQSLFARAFIDGTNRLILEREKEAANLSALKKSFYE